MSYEELMLRKYTPLLWKKTHDFLRKTGLSDSYYRDDIFQEGCIAFIAFLRSGNLQHDELSNDERQRVARYIELHYLSAFQDNDGIGLNRNNRKAYYAAGNTGLESIEHLEAVIAKEGKTAQIEAIRDPSSLNQIDIDAGNLFTQVTVNEWMAHLTEEDRATVLGLCRGQTVMDIARCYRQSRQHVRTRLRHMRRSFSEYVEEYPVA